MSHGRLDDVLSQLSGVRRDGKGWNARCPAHDDHNPSLSVAQGDDGRVLLYCHAGCDAKAVAGTMGLRMADLMPHRSTAPPPRQAAKRPSGNGSTGNGKLYPSRDAARDALARHVGRVVGEWPYHNADGREAMRMIRFEPSDREKDYRPIHPAPQSHGWKIGDPPGPLPLYRLPDLADAERVYVCEGEKAADAARSLGFTATAAAHRCKSPRKSDWTPLGGRDVVILPDDDDPGWGYARTVARTLLDLDPAMRVRIVDLPGLPDKGDIVDWLTERDAHDTPELRAEIERLADATRPTTAADMVEGVKTVCLADVESRPVEWLWPGRIPLGKLTMLAGDPGLGKSFLTMDIAARVSRGIGWPDAPDAVNEPGRVVLLSAEDDLEDTIRPRLEAAGTDLDRIRAVTAVQQVDQSSGMFSLATDADKLDHLLTRMPDVRLVVIDPISAYLGRTDSHKNAEVRGLLGPLAALASKHRVAVLAVSHLNKTMGANAQYRISGSVAFTATARATWLVSKDRDDPQCRLMLPSKNNLASDAAGLAYRLRDSSISGIAKLAWEAEPVAMTADDALAAGEGDGERGEREEAADWIHEALADGPMPAKDMKRLASESGHAWATVKRAKKAIGVEVNRRGFGPGAKWHWSLPDHRRSPDAIGAQPEDVSAYGEG